MKKIYSWVFVAIAMSAVAQENSPQFVGLMSAPTTATESDVIWTPPCIEAGTSWTYHYEVGCKGMTRVGLTEVEYDSADGMKGEIVSNTMGDDYYILNPLPRVNIGSYIKGTLVEEGDDLYIECQLPQWLNAREETNTGVMLSLGTPFRGVDGLQYYEPETDPEKNKIRYVMDENENFVLDVSDENETALVALYMYLDEELEKGVFAGSAITSAKYVDVGRGKVGVTIPDNVKPEEWGMLYSNGAKAHKLVAAVDGDKVYIAGYNPAFPDAVVVGTIEGEKVIFEGGQYVGETENSYEYLVFNKAEYISSDDRGDVYDFQGKVLPTCEAIFDADAMTISCPMDIAWFTNASTNSLYYSAYFVGPMFLLDKGGAAIPVDPEITEVMEFEPNFGYGGFIADMPLMSTEGQVLDKNYYTYIVYFDGEPYTFLPEIFPGLTVPMTEIPYDFEDGETEDFRVEGSEHIICWRTDGFSSLGVQALYTIDGQTNRSAVVTYQLSNGVDSINESMPIDIEFYDLTGNKVVNPKNGIYVKRINFENGKSMTSKIVIK